MQNMLKYLNYLEVAAYLEQFFFQFIESRLWVRLVIIYWANCVTVIQF